MSNIEIATHAFAAFFMIFWGAKIETSGSHLAVGVGMYLIFKIAPVAIGIMFAFNIYLHFMGVVL